METVGVEAIVDGLMSFSSDMDKVQGKIDDIGGRGMILGNIFDAVSSTLTSFGREILNIAEVALGTMLRDAIEGTIAFIGDMIEKVIEAGNEFQILELRLNNLNMDALMKSGMDYDTAAKEAVKLTKEQLDWLQKLAMVTPYDNTDISNVYTLGRAYGFTADQSEQLTENTADFASAMGLTGAHMERIIVNLGQMKARGKITSTELRDLARGAFLPLDDVLGRVAKSMNMTTAELTKLISKPGEGVPYQNFIDAFNQMIEQEPRFVGAAEKMARTLQYAGRNVQDLVTSFGGLRIVTPVMDVLGAKVADFMDQFIKSDTAGQSFTALGERLQRVAMGIGGNLTNLVSRILGLAPSSNDLATSLVEGLEKFSMWLANNKDVIVEKIKEIWDWLTNLGKSDLAVGLGNIIQGFQSLSDQLFKADPRTHKTGWEELGQALTTLGVAIQPILDFLGINITVLPQVTGLVDNLVVAINEVSKWIYNNQELIKTLLSLLIAYLVIDTVTGMFWKLVAVFISAATAVALLAVAFGAMMVIVGIVMAIVAAFKIFQLGLEAIKIIVTFVVQTIIGQFQNLWKTLTNIWTEMGNAFRTNPNWYGVGQAIVEGVARGIQGYVGVVVQAAQNAAMSAYNAAKNILGIKSPSVLFAGIGENLMAGMAQGITDSAGLAVDAMRNVVAAVSMPAMSMQVSQAAPRSISSTYQNNTTNNLNIYSQAQSEQVASSFEMMNSLAGV